MKQASVQATPEALNSGVPLVRRKEAPAKPKIIHKRGIRLRSHRSVRRVRNKGTQTEEVPAPAEASTSEAVPKRKPTDEPPHAPKIKEIEVLRPAFYTSTPIPLLNRIKAQKELIECERKRLQEIHARRLAASAVPTPIVDIFADDFNVDDATYEEWLLSDLS